uniref:PH01B015M02.12 protein n=1 Tax=Phyllostachys edulis TaxID=38705 RepID=L0P1R7_PHYED|nr:PH01B015M02.12 [Phyllostachys edulis]
MEASWPELSVAVISSGESTPEVLEGEQPRSAISLSQWIQRHTSELEKWSILYDTDGARYEIMATNISEVCNSVLKEPPQPNDIWKKASGGPRICRGTWTRRWRRPECTTSSAKFHSYDLDTNYKDLWSNTVQWALPYESLRSLNSDIGVKNYDLFPSVICAENWPVDMNDFDKQHRHGESRDKGKWKAASTKTSQRRSISGRPGTLRIEDLHCNSIGNIDTPCYTATLLEIRRVDIKEDVEEEDLAPAEFE